MENDNNSKVHLCTVFSLSESSFTYIVPHNNLVSHATLVLSRRMWALGELNSMSNIRTQKFCLQSHPIITQFPHILSPGRQCPLPSSFILHEDALDRKSEKNESSDFLLGLSSECFILWKEFAVVPSSNRDYRPDVSGKKRLWLNLREFRVE